MQLESVTIHIHNYVDSIDGEQKLSTSTSFSQNQAFQLSISESSDISALPALSRPLLQTFSDERLNTNTVQANHKFIQTLPMLSVKSDASEKLDADSIGKSNNQEISKNLLLDNEQTVQ